MSSVRSRVKRALSDEQTSSESNVSSMQPTSETHSMTEDELTNAVKEGLTEALEERSMVHQEGETTESDTDESEGSGRGNVMRLMVLGALVAIGMLARRRLQSGGSQSSPDYQEPGE